MIEFLNNIDTRLFLFLNGLHSDFFDHVMFFISGKKEWIPLYVAIIILVIVKFRMKGVWAVLSMIVLLVLTDQVSVHLFKNVFERLRPTHNPDLDGLVHIVNNYRGGQFGFVSSHAANTFGFAMFLTLLFNNKYLTGFMFTWAAVVSYSRIYLGVHYPGDIMGGAILGVILGIAVFYIYNQFMNRFYTK